MAAKEETHGEAQPPKHKEPFAAPVVPPLYIALNPFAWLLWLLDIAIWTVSIIGPLKWFRYLWDHFGAGRQVAYEISPGWRCSGLNPKGTRMISLVPEEPEVTTCHELMQRNFRFFGPLRCFGTRQYLGDYRTPGMKFPLKMFGETSWLTYSEVQVRAKAFGCGLLQIGLRPQPKNSVFDQLPPGHSILLWEDTSADWMTALVGAGGQAIAVTTSYSTLGVAAVIDAVNRVGCKVMLCNYSQVARVVELKKDCPCLETIIYTHLNVEPSKVGKPPLETKEVRIISFEEVVALGEKNPCDYHEPLPSDISVVMYTSGSTGTPKGVVIKHESFVAAVAGLKEWVRNVEGISLEGGESYVAYLPSAHILELVADHCMLAIGAEMGFADPRTITSRGACRKRPDGTVNTKPGWPYPPGALQEFRPSLLCGVPKIWDIFKKNIEDTIGHANPVVRFVFSVAFSGRHFALRHGRESPLFKLLFGGVVQKMVGGRLRFALTGGGPLSPEVQSFIRTVFAIPFIQGYALTETSCAGTVQYVDDNRDSVVGPPLASVMIRLNDCPDLEDREGKPYLSTDKLHIGTPCAGRGEVWVTGKSVSVGYLKDPEMTATEYVEYEGHRWFRTGDIGCYTTDGCIRIVDRLKNLVKLRGGEYIAIEHMEAVYSTHIFVDAVNGGLLCYGDGDMDRPVAFVQVHPKQIEVHAKEVGMSYNSTEELCENPKIEKWVCDELNAIGKKAGLQSIELLGAVRLFAGTGPHERPEGPARHDPWTTENQMLTATNKLNRKPIQRAYSALLEELKQSKGRR